MGAAPGGVVALSMGEFRFTLAGTPTSWNPIEAFKQGLADEPEDRNMPVVIWRCPKCGMLELAAVEG
jgi:hypothetical protein